MDARHALALLITAGCFAQPPVPQAPPLPDPGSPTLPGATCGDGVCEFALGESCVTCTADCGECPAPEPPPPACDATDLGAQTDVTGTTSGVYDWTTPAGGRYQLAVSADFALAVEVRGGSCNGSVIATTSSPGNATATLTVSLATSQTIAISIAAQGGATGSFTLDLTRLADECGDGVCEASEDANSCAQDCATTTTTGDDGSTTTTTGGDDGSTTTTTGGDDGSTTTTTGGDDGSDYGDDSGDDGDYGDDGGDDSGDYGDSGDDSGDDGDDGDDCDDCARLPHRAPAHGGAVTPATASRSSGPNR